ncbi:response regulator [Desulforhopalus sp. IMCC35007]|uniref:response regulator n=1 Tax=Desulforhopalus sp. IMCC35007 TaxID=2569543 RepID=UPI0010AEBC21|nr:transporter substrate-binding domain-containing protein [Desulforhopalus sp. IMCC35007]
MSIRPQTIKPTMRTEKTIHKTIGQILGQSCATFLFLVCIFLTLTPRTLQASSTPTAITVGVYSNEPTLFIDNNGNPAGIFIDILESIAEKEGWQLEYTVGHFDKLFNDVVQGKIDLLPAVAYSEKREEIIDYNYANVIANWAGLYTAKSTQISSFLELKNKIIGVKAGDIHFFALQKMMKNFNIECRYLETDEYTTVFEMLQAGVIDVAVVNRLFGEKNKLQFAAEETSVLFNPIEMRFAVPKGQHQQLTHTIDTYLSRFKADETSIYYKTINKWLMVETKYQKPFWLRPVLYATLGITFFLCITLILFRLQVRNRTAELQEINKNLVSQIKERKKAEETLQKYARVIEASNDAIALIDRNNIHVFTNKVYRSIAVTPTASITGTSIIDYLGEDFYNLELKDAVASCLQGETVQIQTRPRLGHNNEFYWNITISPYYSTARELEGYVIDIHDVTEQVELQNRLKNSQKMEAIGMLAGGVAHDLNNILSGLVSYPDMLLINKSPDDPMTTPLLTIKKSGERAATIVQDLLTLARRGVGTQVITNINTIIREFLTSPEHRSITKSVSGIEYNVNLENGLPNIKGSAVHLSKILMNFFTNGVEAMPEGGRLSISTKKVTLTEEYTGYEAIPPGSFSTLTITDTGIGMSTGEINRVFEPFYTSKIMGRSGTGLGMAVVWGTVKDHNGYIDIKSKPGQGTTFMVYFPTTDELLVEQDKCTLKDYLGNNENILVVDDLEEQRILTKGILTNLNYKVDVAGSGLEAIEKCQKQTYELLVLDMIMPGEYDGLSTFEAIKSSNPRQKAIIVSGFSETSRVKKAQALGAGTYIKKPYSVESLATTIYRELNGSS